MSSTLRIIPLLLIAVLATTAVKAETVPGFYTDFGAGVSFIPDTTAKTASGNKTTTFKLGTDLHGGAGYAWACGFRLEGDVFHNRASADTIKSGGGTGGSLSATDFFANALYDFNFGWPVTPYVGAGVGLALNEVSHYGTPATGGPFSDTQTNVAYDAIAGVALQLDPNWAVTADYRYVTSPDNTFKSTLGDAKLDNTSHNFIVGVRYSFGEPEAVMAHPIVPNVHTTTSSGMVVPTEPGHYVVFFDFAKHSLSPDAKKILALAAKEYKAGHYVNVVVTGHTDTMGTDKLNDPLSLKRAKAVQAELIKLGVKKSAIVTKGVGDKQLLVQTKNGVKEVQNRRADIVLETK